MSTTLAKGRYRLTVTHPDGLERELTSSNNRDALLELRLLLTAERKRRQLEVLYRVLDSEETQ